MKILIAKQEIAGYYTALEKGFRAIGAECDFVRIHDSSFQYAATPTTSRVIYLRELIAKQVNNFKGNIVLLKIFKMFANIARTFLWYMWGINAIFKYNVFIFGFGQSLFRGNIDLIILRILRKKVLMNLSHVSEARPLYLSAAFQKYDIHTLVGSYKIKYLIIRTKKRIRFCMKYSNYTIGHPYNLASFANRKFINHNFIGIPCDISKSNLFKTKLTDRYNSKSVRILHAPSNSSQKGTSIIENSIENLKNKGYSIDFVKIEGRNNVEVLRELELCDFVVDQVYSDTPMAGFASEAAIFGKPAIVGGYGLDELKSFYSPEDFPPAFTCLPDDITKAIELLIVDTNLRESLGERAKYFVENNLSCEVVASKFLKLITDNFPSEWWLDPEKVSYSSGSGISQTVIQEQVRDLVNRFGSSALGLNDKPALKYKILREANLKVE